MRLAAVLLVPLLSAAAAGAAFADPVAEATSAVPKASYSHGGASQPLEVGSPLDQNDRIRTDANGAAEIEFVDGTSLTIGANSEVVLDKMLFDGDKAKNATVQIVKGTLRFVTGSSDHGAYQIKTPVATVGVRGTVIDMSVDGGDLVFNTVEGIGVVCQGGSNCRDIRAGEQPVAVNRMGFRLASAAQLSRLTRIVGGAHTNLSRRIGRDPRFGKGWEKRSGLDNKRGMGRFGERDKNFGGKDFKEGGGRKSFGQKLGERWNQFKGGRKERGKLQPQRDRDRQYR